MEMTLSAVVDCEPVTLLVPRGTMTQTTASRDITKALAARVYQIPRDCVGSAIGLATENFASNLLTSSNLPISYPLKSLKSKGCRLRKQNVLSSLSYHILSMKNNK